jgi:hypothetical protein
MPETTLMGPANLVWSKNSCGFTLVIFQEPTEPFATPNWACTLFVLADRRKEQHVTLSLMISLMMIMVHVLFEHMPKSTLAKQNQPRQDLVLDRLHPAFRVGIQIRRPRRQDHALDPYAINDLLKRWAELSVPIMDEGLSWSQESPLLHCHVAGHLHHPGWIGMRRHARDVNPSACEMYEEEHVVGHQPTPNPHLNGEKVGRHQHVHVGMDKLMPGRGPFALGRRWNPMALQDIPHGLVADRVT